MNIKGCSLNDYDFEALKDELGVSPCQEYGMCEVCPYYETESGVMENARE